MVKNHSLGYALKLYTLDPLVHHRQFLTIPNHQYHYHHPPSGATEVLTDGLGTNRHPPVLSINDIHYHIHHDPRKNTKSPEFSMDHGESAMDQFLLKNHPSFPTKKSHNHYHDQHHLAMNRPKFHRRNPFTSYP